MTEFKTISRHAASVLVGQLAVMAYSVVDTVVASRYSAASLAALSVGSAVYVSVFVALLGVMQALLPILSEHRGAGRTRLRGLVTLFAGPPSRGARGRRGRLAGIKVVPVHDGVEAQGERALSLPAPEGPDGEHDDVALSDRRVHDTHAVRQELTVREGARKQHVRGIAREGENHARPGARIEIDPKSRRH